MKKIFYILFKNKYIFKYKSKTPLKIDDPSFERMTIEDMRATRSGHDSWSVWI